MTRDQQLQSMLDADMDRARQVAAGMDRALPAIESHREWVCPTCGAWTDTDPEWQVCPVCDDKPSYEEIEVCDICDREIVAGSRASHQTCSERERAAVCRMCDATLHHRRGDFDFCSSNCEKRWRDEERDAIAEDVERDRRAERA